MSAVVNAPRWAERILRLVLGPDRAETVYGDLLEEYRDKIYPARGASSADTWLAIQVGGFVYRALWAWIAVAALAFIGRSVADTFWPPADFNWGPRSAFTTYTLSAFFVAAGGWAARRSGRVVSGALAAAAAHVAASAIAIVYDVAFFFAIIQPSPERLRLFRMTGGWEELLIMPLVILPVVLALGAIGGVLGFLNSRRPALT